MGIRYDRDFRRATNGPMFFFSIIKDETFAEEIRSAFLSGLSFYAYRYPHDKMLCYGSSEGFIEGLGVPGFTIGMFSPNKPFITIPYHFNSQNQSSIGCLYSMPEKSTSFEEYRQELEGIVAAIKEGKGSKVVAARVIVEEANFDIVEKFYELSERFPDAFVFCFSTQATGCWIGASPELLLESKNSIISSMALAGTRPIGWDEPWDEKNVEEQKIVADYIADIFERNGLNPEIGKTYTKEAGSIEHICTEIRGKGISFSAEDRGSDEIRSDFKENKQLENLLRDLSPTPALCGFPKDFALNEIEKYEHFDRGCYGGFCGPFHSLNDFRFNVVLRCGAISEMRQCFYVGGGITSKSQVSSEWAETEVKYNSIK